MTASNPEVAPADRSGRGYLIGSGILAVIMALFSHLRGGREVGRTTAYVIGQVVGSLVMSALVAAIIFAIARAATRGKPRSTSAKILFWILLVWTFLLFANFVGRAANPRSASAQSVFSTEDRQGLRIGADSITHASLGFAMPKPGKSLTASPMIEREMAGMFGGQLPSDLINWAFLDSTQHWAFIIQVVGMPDLDKAKFLEYTRGMRNGLSKRVTIVSDTAVWEGSRREAQFVGQHPNGVYLGMRCLPSVKPRREYILCIQTFSAEATTLARLGGGLAFY